MYSLRNITVQEFLTSKDYLNYDEILKHITAKKNEVNILQNSYTNIKYCISLLQKEQGGFDGITEVFEILFGFNKETLMQLKVLKYYELRNYVIETFKNIVNNEMKLAQGGNTNLAKWQFAGGDKLRPYDNVLPLDQLAERYGGNPFDWGKKSYSEVFFLIAMNKNLNEVNYNYSKE